MSDYVNSWESSLRVRDVLQRVDTGTKISLLSASYYYSRPHFYYSKSFPQIEQVWLILHYRSLLLIISIDHQ